MRKMKRINKKASTLIKGNSLILRMKKAGIKRINPEIISLVDDYIKEELDKIIPALKEEMLIQGRKTLRKEDFKRVLKEIKSQ